MNNTQASVTHGGDTALSRIDKVIDLIKKLTELVKELSKLAWEIGALIAIMSYIISQVN